MIFFGMQKNAETVKVSAMGMVLRFVYGAYIERESRIVSYNEYERSVRREVSGIARGRFRSVKRNGHEGSGGASFFIYTYA